MNSSWAHGTSPVYAANGMSPLIPHPKTDPSVAAVPSLKVNNNPLEYWTTYDAPAYTKLMEDYERMIEAPGAADVPLGAVFPAEAFEELTNLMRASGWEGVDEVCAIWPGELSQKLIVSGFLKDKDIGSKR